MKHIINKLKDIISIIKKVLKSDSYFIYTVNNNELQGYYKHTNKISDEHYSSIVNDVKQHLLDDKCNGLPQIYSTKLELYDPDLYTAYKQLDYTEAKLEYVEADFMYYKDMNTPYSGDANHAYMLYQRVLDKKKKYQELEKQL